MQSFSSSRMPGTPRRQRPALRSNPEVLKAVVAAVKRYKPKEIIMAEALGIGQDTFKVLAMSGLRQAAEEAGVDRVVDINCPT